MKKTTTYLILISCLSSFSCNEKIIQSEIPEISPEYFVEKDYSLSYFTDDIEYIKLDSQVWLRSIPNVKIIDSLIFLSASGYGVLQYNINGTFIRQIGKRGKGPREYEYGFDFTIDRIHQRIYIADYNKTIVYTYQGKFIREYKRNIEEDYWRLLYMDNQLFGMSPFSLRDPRKQVKWYVYDTLGNLKYRRLGPKSTYNIIKSEHILVSNRCAYRFNDKLHYWGQFMDTVFELSGNSHKVKYLFKKDKYRMTPEVDLTFKNTGLNKYYQPRTLFESSKYLFMYYFHYGKHCLMVYDKVKRTYVTKSYAEINNSALKIDGQFGIINDIDGGIAVPLRKLAYHEFNNNEYYSIVIPVINLKEHIESDQFKNSKVKYPEKKKALITLANSLSENDNPVLMLVRLKQ